jgi:signal transduction histidine kinase/ActR/RegA family two-component response regulator
LIAFGVAWIMIQPILQVLFSEISPYISEIQRPEIFFLTSVIAAFTVYQLHWVLERNVQHETKQNLSTKASARRQEILLQLASKPEADFHRSIAKIIEASATELALSRVGLWLYNDSRTSINSVAHFATGEINYKVQNLHQADVPAYFAALELSGMLVAPDARTHPASRELAEPYLIPEGIFSLLDVPVRLEGKVIGILCHEETTAPRDWSIEDQDFAHSLADLCALCIAERQRSQIEQELRESQRHLEDAQDVGQFASFRWDPDADELVCYGAVVRSLGLKEGLQRSVRQAVYDLLVKPDQRRLVEAIEQATQTRDAFRVRVQTTEERNSRHIEIRARFFDPENAPGAFEGTLQDITDQILIERENQRLESQLIQSQKMESIGTMAGGIAHDFNNILTPILGYTDLAMAEAEPDAPVQVPLQEILNSSLRAKDLVGQILLFSRRFDESREPVDMQQIIHSALRLIRHTLPSSIKIEVDIEPGYKMVEADPTQMVQIVVNLCTNAWHAMEPNGGELHIGLKPAVKDDIPMSLLSVRDTGVGIAFDAQERIFEPFYTTKEVGHGTGLGLSMVHGIVTKLGGIVEVHSDVGRGSEFLIYMPVTDLQPTVEQSSEPAAASDSASILVVDDDEAVAGILKSMLTDLGYHADVHLDGHSALSSFRDHPAEYDMVVTDLTMPEMSGVDLCKQVHKIEPEIPVFILTGYSKEMVQDQIKNCGPCQIIGKPLVKADLAAALAKELH